MSNPGKRTQHNSTLPSRAKPLPRGQPPARRTRVKVKNARRKGHLFPKFVDESFRKWVRQRPCLIGRKHTCVGEVQCCHVRARGAGGGDQGNAVAMCYGAHEEQHRIGKKSFEKKYAVNLAESARYLGEWFVEKIEEAF